MGDVLMLLTAIIVIHSVVLPLGVVAIMLIEEIMGDD